MGIAILLGGVHAARRVAMRQRESSRSKSASNALRSSFIVLWSITAMARMNRFRSGAESIPAAKHG